MHSGGAEFYQNLRCDFFYDEKVILSFNDSSKFDQLKGHLVLLGSNVENFLKLATLIDGSTVDFLFGVKYSNSSDNSGLMGRSRANEVKKFIRSLDVQGQEGAAEFYYAMYSAIADYHHQNQKCCGCVFFLETNKERLFSQLDRAFNTFRKYIHNKPQYKQ